MKSENRFRTSRKKFFYVYLFGILVIFLYPSSDFHTKGGVYDYLFYATILGVIIVPEIKILYTDYFVGKDVIIESKGFIAKKRTTIPISSISHVVMKKSLTGALLNFGDVIVTSFTDLVITFEGINHPDKLLSKIEDMMERANKGLKT